MIAAVDPSRQVAETVKSYIAGVQSGEIVAGRLVRLAVDRHVKDLGNAHERGWHFSRDIATRACLFFPMCLRHSIGEYAGEPFDLSPWQTFVVWTLYGWINGQTKLRRFRKALIEVARKNGKTTFAAGLGLRAMYADEPFEPGAQVYCSATKEPQAKILYDEAARMVAQCDWLKALTKQRKAPHMLDYAQMASFFKPLSSDGSGSDGFNPHMVIKDELHAWRQVHRDFSEKLSSGSGARRQPLELITTTAGDAESQLWIEEHDYAEYVLEQSEQGNIIDDGLFAYIAQIDKDDDPFEEKNWSKANPNLGISVKVDYLRQQANEAKHKPTDTNKFLRYHCNLKTEATERTFSPEAWAAGAVPIDIPDGCYGHGGIDMGRSNDWAAVGLCFPRYEFDGRDKVRVGWQLLSRAWTCSDGDFDVSEEPFRSWIKSGKLECVRGNCIESVAVENWIVEQSAKYDIKTWAFDKTYCRELALRLQDVHGLEVFEFTQSARYYNEPFITFVNEMPKGTIWHGNDPVLNWQAANVQTYRAPGTGHCMPDKSKAKRKIDAVVALMMAFSECLFAEQKASGPLVI